MNKASRVNVAKDVVELRTDYPIAVTEARGIAPHYQRLHWHDLPEINLIKQGRGYYVINGRTIEFQEGDILLIGSNDLHRAYELDDLVILVISFSASWFLADMRYDPALLSPFSEMGIHYRNLLARDHPGMAELRELLATIQAEHVRKAYSHVSVIRSHLLRFLAYVGREFRLEVPSRDARPVHALPRRLPVQLHDVLALMELQYDGEWDLKRLSERACLSPARFSALFKQTMGASPMDHLIRIRLSNAARLLEESDKKIVDVAYECGFRNLSNFNRLFKIHYGFSPSLARDRLRSDRM